MIIWTAEWLIWRLKESFLVGRKISYFNLGSLVSWTFRCFFFKFWRTQVLFVGPLISLFLTSTSALGFKARVDPFLRAFSPVWSSDSLLVRPILIVQIYCYLVCILEEFITWIKSCTCWSFLLQRRLFFACVRTPRSDRFSKLLNTAIFSPSLRITGLLVSLGYLFPLQWLMSNNNTVIKLCNYDKNEAIIW